MATLENLNEICEPTYLFILVFPAGWTLATSFHNIFSYLNVQSSSDSGLFKFTHFCGVLFNLKTPEIHNESYNKKSKIYQLSVGRGRLGINNRKNKTDALEQVMKITVHRDDVKQK